MFTRSRPLSSTHERHSSVISFLGSPLYKTPKARLILKFSFLSFQALLYSPVHLNSPCQSRSDHVTKSRGQFSVSSYMTISDIWQLVNPFSLKLFMLVAFSRTLHSWFSPPPSHNPFLDHRLPDLGSLVCPQEATKAHLLSFPRLAHPVFNTTECLTV